MITAAGRGKCVLHCFLLLKHSWNEKWFDLNLRVTTTSLLREACVPLTHVTMGMSRRVTQNVCVCVTLDIITQPIYYLLLAQSACCVHDLQKEGAAKLSSYF